MMRLRLMQQWVHILDSMWSHLKWPGVQHPHLVFQIVQHLVGTLNAASHAAVGTLVVVLVVRRRRRRGLLLLLLLEGHG